MSSNYRRDCCCMIAALAVMRVNRCIVFRGPSLATCASNSACQLRQYSLMLICADGRQIQINKSRILNLGMCDCQCWDPLSVF
jgi:hypothetical protein